MREIERRLGVLRLLLADLMARREQTESARRQIHSQKAQVVEFVVQRNGSVSTALDALAELDERLARAEGDLRHIELLRRRAQEELDALVVMRGVGDAQKRLEELIARRDQLRAEDGALAAHSIELAEIEAEMTELHATIAAASEAAARALAERGYDGPRSER